MQIGIFSKTFVRSGLDVVLDAVAGHGLTSVQFNLSSAGLETDMPTTLDAPTCTWIDQELKARQITMSAISGTYNMIHPDLQQRQAGLAQLRLLAAHCAQLGTKLITLCTGTRDPQSMWRWHADSYLPDAWQDLTTEMAKALEIAEKYGVTLGIEPEVSNVVDSAQRARRLLDEMRSPNLKIVMDGANLFHQGELPRMRELLDEAFDLLGAEIALVHAKDLLRDGEAGNAAAGTGLLDYDHYIHLLRASGYQGALILHSLAENQVAASVQFLRSKLASNQ